MGQFIDFDKRERIFYNNLYLEDSKLVVKVPLSDVDYKKLVPNVKIEKFDLANRAYILSY